MRKAIKYFAEVTYKPLLIKYLSEKRSYTYDGIKLIIPPQVFHPGFFFSTKLLLKYIKRFNLNHKTFLELGAGSGLIAFSAAKRGAVVTATDINPMAIAYLKENSRRNNFQIEIIPSDLFGDIPQRYFDFIAINPPYYKKNPETLKEYAWYCGENGEYFHNLFGSLAQYINKSSTVLIILCDGCDLEMVFNIAHQNKFHLNCVYSKKNLVEQNFIYRVEQQC